MVIKDSTAKGGTPREVFRPTSKNPFGCPCNFAVASCVLGFDCRFPVFTDHVFRIHSGRAGQPSCHGKRGNRQSRPLRHLPGRRIVPKERRLNSRSLAYYIAFPPDCQVPNDLIRAVLSLRDSSPAKNQIFDKASLSKFFLTKGALSVYNNANMHRKCIFLPQHGAYRMHRSP